MTNLESLDFAECESVDECFSYFTSAMLKILSKADFLTLRRACLENSNKMRGVTIPADIKADIRTSQNLNELFDVLCDNPQYWNWMNIKMLTKMARASHMKAATQLIQQYRDEVYSRKLMEVLQQIPKLTVSDKHYSKAREKWNKNDDVTVNDLVKHWSQVEQIFDVEEPTILLDVVIDGCVEIHWLIPTELIEHICQSIKTKISMLHGNNILYFDINGQLIKCPPIPSLTSTTLAAVHGMFLAVCIYICLCVCTYIRMYVCMYQCLK